jgi:tRNA (adenine37-N6)-methyltransferase
MSNAGGGMDTFCYKPIGIIHAPFKEAKGTPCQSAAAGEVEGSVEMFDEFVEGLKDLDGFSHIILIYQFHLSKAPSLIIKPFLDDKTHGVFATRSPCRPNSIGISTVSLISITGNNLCVRGVDMIDGTPLLDIKPYVPRFDDRKAEKIGWLENNIHKMSFTRDDGRFQK